MHQYAIMMIVMYRERISLYLQWAPNTDTQQPPSYSPHAQQQQQQVCLAPLP